MKKSAIVLLSAFLSLSVFAQSVQEGVNHLSAQRYQSAKSVFDKLVAANPNNIEASYFISKINFYQWQCSPCFSRDWTSRVDAG
jgi:hypothetical protein